MIHSYDKVICVDFYHVINVNHKYDMVICIGYYHVINMNHSYDKFYMCENQSCN